MNARIAVNTLVVLALTACHTPPPAPLATCFSFEPPLTVGTTYGPPLTPGATILTNGPLSMSIETFVQVSGNTSFNLAMISSPPMGGNSSQMLRANNINFKVAAVGSARLVTFDYVDLGGSENFSVNGSAVNAGELSSLPTIISGVSIAVTQTPVFNSGGVQVGKGGKLTLQGQISQFIVGGQEFWIDNVCATK